MLSPSTEGFNASKYASFLFLSIIQNKHKNKNEILNGNSCTQKIKREKNPYVFRNAETDHVLL